ncbi:DUF1853 family protein [Chitinivorax sp. B]|uniref:DUF1853 family protein n=1 Tax=Chitinivorax sp. B TaxID=2502235 RepID=UPI0010F70F26|nr:DUF1853 family protein [Chitinivorax sp. B]
MHTTGLPTTLGDLHVRNLAWLATAPGLASAVPVNSCDACLTDAWYARCGEVLATWLQVQDASPQTLHAHVAPFVVGRLGYYVEALLAYLFEHAPGFGLIAQHLLIKRGQITIGELDFLAQLPEFGLSHVECAFKLFLQTGNGPTSLVGPNPADRLDLKLQRLQTHQLPMSAQPEALAMMPVRPGQALAWLKGWLFYAWHDWQAGQWLHPNGWWVYWRPSERPDWLNPTCQYAILPKVNWVATVTQHQVTTYDTQTLHAILAQRFSTHPRPMLIAELVQMSYRDWQERSRGFIVPSSWPAFAADSSKPIS